MPKGKKLQPASQSAMESRVLVCSSGGRICGYELSVLKSLWTARDPETAYGYDIIVGSSGGGLTGYILSCFPRKDILKAIECGLQVYEELNPSSFLVFPSNFISNLFTSSGILSGETRDNCKRIVQNVIHRHGGISNDQEYAKRDTKRLFSTLHIIVRENNINRIIKVKDPSYIFGAISVNLVLPPMYYKNHFYSDDGDIYPIVLPEKDIARYIRRKAPKTMHIEVLDIKPYPNLHVPEDESYQPPSNIVSSFMSWLQKCVVSLSEMSRQLVILKVEKLRQTFPSTTIRLTTYNPQNQFQPTNDVSATMSELLYFFISTSQLRDIEQIPYKSVEY